MLELQNVTHVYPNGVRALDDVTLSIPKGMFGLLGPNGAGKSTLMRTVATLQTPSSGSIRFGDIDVLENPEELRKQLGYLPQDFGVYPRVSAYDMLDHMAVLKGISSASDRKATVETLLNQVNLWGVRKKAIAGFSGGMRQRFGIAQALIGNPNLIIVDEPTAGLDPIGAAAFDNLTRELKETLGLTVFLITHDLDTLHEICDRVAVLADKKVIAVDTVPNLMELDHPWIQEYFNGPRGRAALTAQALDELRSHMDKPLAANVVKALDKPPAGKA